MTKLVIAWDIDDTLIIPSVVTGDRDTPNYENIAIYKWFQSQGHTMVLWSGSGTDWAQTWWEKLGLAPFKVLVKEARIVHKGSDPCIGRECDDDDYEVDLCFDDCLVDLAKVNIQVKRHSNHISRAEWNKRKI